ncbi:prepilin-type N-terminal cleavage/methylation domain-containing protein [Vibrio sp. SCSIO 43135]|uniref:PilW family protein n=1 Tax=Vibrio sp. SCSIO 43135 TaxID=2819096 RepID=UPI002074E6A4|nr:prepilin-type N-terminal cleavage/methylation domain-containing protein [Vibrio sp. SCSIO 43135]USD41503.1 prepilin-type N-terminal cleavage/methylation domain-containing protein [Vibrio sp. SCSIO 43135]
MRQLGFTLIEMILTIIVGSIIVLGIAGFVELGASGYADTVDRQRLQTQARFVLEKMSREVRHSVPNSIESDSDCLSFYPIDYSGFYSVSAADNLSLSFIVGNETPPSDYSGYSMVINPSRQSDLTDHGIALSGASSTITLSEPLDSESIANRHYIYSELVTYCFDSSASRITREVNSNIVQVADSVESAAFNYSEPTLQRGGIVHIGLTLSNNGESSNFQQDVQVLNVP